MQLPDFKRPNDFIQWWVEKVDGDKRHDSYALTGALIQLNIAGIQSTGMVVCAKPPHPKVFRHLLIARPGDAGSL